MKDKRYKVLSGVKSLIIVEGSGLTKKEASKISKNVGGWYTGEREFTILHKVRKPIKGKYNEKVRTKILVDRRLI